MKSFIYTLIVSTIICVAGCKCNPSVPPCSSSNNTIEREVETHDTYKPWWVK